MQVTLENAELLEAITLYLNKKGIKGTFAFVDQDEDYEIGVNVVSTEDVSKPRKKRTVKKAAAKPAKTPETPEKGSEEVSDANQEDNQESQQTAKDVQDEMEGKTPAKKKARVFGDPA